MAINYGYDHAYTNVLWHEKYLGKRIVYGYGILNEPIVPELETIEASVNQCRDHMQDLTDTIRTVYDNHIIFAERVCAVLNTTTGVSNWGLNISDTQFLLNDANTVYEFHCYDPYSFTHQDLDWAGTQGVTATYPSNEIVASIMENPW